jgi:hypothetical protein
MNVHEITQGGNARALVSCTNKKQREIAEALLVQLVAEAFKAGSEGKYNEGASDAVSWLEEVYGEGIHETDAWKEYVGCDCHDDAEEEE